METRFSVEKEQIFPLLSALQPLCTKRTTVDATSHVLLHIGNRELVVKGTDLEVSLQASCSIKECSCIEGETFLVPGKRIFDIVKELDGVVSCSLENNQLVLQTESIDLRLSIKSADEFPPFPERIENLIHLEATDLLALLEKVAFIIPQGNSNAALNGLFLEIGPAGLTMTATDGHSLAQVHSGKYTLEESRNWLMPRRAVFELKKLVENSGDTAVFVGMCDGHLVFSGEFFNFFTRLIAQPFPEYKPVLEREGFLVGKVDRQQLIKTLKRSACLLSGQFLATRFLFNLNSLQVTFSNKGIGTLDERLPLVKFEGENFDIRFYAPYILDGLQALSDEKVTFYLKNSAKPLIFESQEDTLSTLYLVMPVSPTAR
ncbi:MAG: polymerase III subunit beta protein [candidate division TM6 bacterium GW2011_GWE2_42_60]|nr:MAG: polymerase III subunit beta protein [candidate division TM6 bacterium GW2011_GWE2_42_60]HBY06185.1 DNA polymerase III subunit beta [Candidatus Dependentiae bacterium]